MEHRCSSRMEIRARATLDHPVTGLAIGWVRDASAEGALIEVGGGSFPLNSPITLALHFGSCAQRELLRLPAMVVRATQSSVSVMFLEYDQDTANALQRLLDKWRKPSSRPAAAAGSIVHVPAHSSASTQRGAVELASARA